MFNDEGKQVKLHYNSHCEHGDLPVTRLHLLYADRHYAEALQEVARLNALQLSAPQRLVVNVHEVVIKLATDQVSYLQAKVRLAELSGFVQELDDDIFKAEFCARRVGIAALYGDHALMNNLVFHFFDDIPRTTVTEAIWRVAHGTSAQHIKGPAAAIPFFLTALGQLETEAVDEPCLKEMIARHLAFCLRAIDDKSQAAAVLRRVGLPASIEPSEDEIALADLLVLPLM